VPFENANETRLTAGKVLPLAHLKDVIRVLGLDSVPENLACWPQNPPPATRVAEQPLILGQAMAKRALAIAAAGGHHLLMVGPPGTGKSLLASRLPNLMPPLSQQQAMEVAAVYSAAGLDLDDPGIPPFRNPHHSISSAAMIGGSAQPRPGEISLAHHGVLFLDELPHFKPSVLDTLREPLESRQISIARVSGRARFPASFQLLAAMNPCPAGLVCSESSCRCRPDQVRRYQARISGPLLDRIDLHVPVGAVPKELLLGESSAAPADEPGREEVARARQRQLQRQGKLNAFLTAPGLNDHVPLGPDEKRVLSRASDRYRLSARGFHRVLRVARSVADMEGETRVGTRQLNEALGYRAMDWSTGL
jgi:magnesium chelatase family protein